MLTVAAALKMILQQTRPLPSQTLPLTTAVLGAVLAEDVVSDLDMPPHDKALMDGYAVRSADLPEGQGTLNVIEEITAGRTPTKPVQAGQASRIMTGAPLPEGADAVIAVERTQMLDDGRVRIADRPPRPELNLLRRGREMKRGENIVPAGTRLRPQEFGVLATVGRTAVQVISAPRVALLTTGDEVVDASQTPGPAQIRNSNGPMLMAQTSRAGGAPRSLGIGRDSMESLRPLVNEGLHSDVLLLSGGVSAGKLDLVPDVLRDAGVVPHFHHVEMKPGKPLFFGAVDRPGQPARTLVFGLPGNPVSSFVCFELFIRPALNRLRGLAQPGPSVVSARLLEDFTYRSERATYHPAWLEVASEGWQVRVTPWFGSADLRGLLRANALILFPPGQHQHQAGQRFDVVNLETDP
jgi:molybdopterin molybdotransferase